MSQLELPDKPVLNSEFARRGRPDVVMIDAFPVRDGELLKGLGLLPKNWSSQ
jgi:hypothetical protein